MANQAFSQAEDLMVGAGELYFQRDDDPNGLHHLGNVGEFNITNDEQFALDLLREKKILIVHGSGFNWKDPDHFRVVYLPRVEVLEDASVKLRDFLEYYRQ